MIFLFRCLLSKKFFIQLSIAIYVILLMSGKKINFYHKLLDLKEDLENKILKA